ncbi:endonuclease/exonuclease/phosphatase family protein [Patulibacter minatonensis]|uniref:endonuclease/exonuclease/phosphatase family protein n=1 Tax=Patulibacter minatonensis TaxID=298163 RepID=UPI00047A2B84|nr:endonuclease/exonuclease/phosphatase family protein [Patulibacter minatonensis]
MRVLTWNLFHGRAVPSAGRPLLHEFATTLAAWPWDVALLQEVPPWWPPLLARAAGADHRAVRTSRNALLPARRAVASRRPDLLKANGGGADAILVRGGLRIDAHAARRLRAWPERRIVHAVRLAVPASGHAGGPSVLDGRPADPTSPDPGSSGAFAGCWVGNLHAQGPSAATHDGPDGPGVPADAPVAFDALARWTGPDDGRPVLLGGDFNLRPGELDGALPAGWSRLASRDVDHLTARGAQAVGAASFPDRTLADGGLLSDHPPLSLRVVARAPPPT